VGCHARRACARLPPQAMKWGSSGRAAVSPAHIRSDRNPRLLTEEHGQRLAFKIHPDCVMCARG
jgi:hypothetical protein